MPAPRSKQRGPWGLITLLLLLCATLVVLALRAMNQEHLYHCHGQEVSGGGADGSQAHHVPMNLVLRLDEDELNLKNYPDMQHNALESQDSIQFSATRGSAHIKGLFDRSSGQLAYSETRPNPVDKRAPLERIQGSFQCVVK